MESIRQISEYKDLKEKYTVQLKLYDMFEHKKIDKNRQIERELLQEVGIETKKEKSENYNLIG